MRCRPRGCDAIVTALALDEADLKKLKTNLQIIEGRRAFRHGLKFSRFPVKPEKGQADDFEKAEAQWRSLVKTMGADLYIIDPMRCMHAQAENDSTIEALLSRVHEFFGDAAVVISHHLRKRNRKKTDQVSLRADMRAWADEARGSGAITAHADVIVCQERVVERGTEKLDFGAYLRDGADIDPIPLRERGSQSFLWQVTPDIPEVLNTCLEALKRSALEFPSRAAAVAVLEQTVDVGRSTGYTRINELVNRGLLIADQHGAVRLTESMDKIAKPV